MDVKNPYRVTTPDGKVRLVVMNATDGLPAAFALMGTRAERKVAIRLAGGCKDMSPADKVQMIDYFSEVFDGYRGLIWSGATRQVGANGQVDPMVTDVPGVIAAANPGCVALGTVPRTSMLTLQHESRIVLDDWGTVLNPDMQGILVVQNGPDGDMDWDGDLNAAFGLMSNWQDYAGFTALGWGSWNGGGVTEQEILRAAKNNWPVFLVEGSGRVTDEIIKKIRAGDEELLNTIPDLSKLVLMHNEDPGTFRSALIELGFMN